MRSTTFMRGRLGTVRLFGGDEAAGLIGTRGEKIFFLKEFAVLKMHFFQQKICFFNFSFDKLKKNSFLIFFSKDILFQIKAFFKKKKFYFDQNVNIFEAFHCQKESSK